MEKDHQLPSYYAKHPRLCVWIGPSARAARRGDGGQGVPHPQLNTAGRDLPACIECFEWLPEAGGPGSCPCARGQLRSFVDAAVINGGASGLRHRHLEPWAGVYDSNHEMQQSSTPRIGDIVRSGGGPADPLARDPEMALVNASGGKVTHALRRAAYRVAIYPWRTETDPAAPNFAGRTGRTP